MKAVNIVERTLQFGINIVSLVAHSQAWRNEIAVLRNQAIRSGTSIGANAMEAQSSSSKQEFRRYVQIALRSSRETEYWLQIFIGAHLLVKEPVEQLLRENI